MIEVREARAEDYKWLAKRAGLVPSSEFRAYKAVEGGAIVGMVGYDGWTPNACAMHVAIEKPMAIRRLLGPAFRLVFQPRPKGLGLGVVFGTVLSTNEKALRLDLGLGFVEIARLRDAWDVGVDLIMLELRREAWEAKYGRS